jgi:hypothetical protein
MVLQPPSLDPWPADHPLDPRVNRDASLYVGAPGICGPGSDAIELHVGSGRGRLPGNAAPLHAAPGDAHGGAVSAVDVAPIAIAADELLGPTIRVRAHEQSRARQLIIAATAVPVMRTQMVWTRTALAAKMPLQSRPCTL